MDYVLNLVFAALPSFFTTVLGGLVLGVIFFLLREKCFPLPDISGEWEVYTITHQTSYHKYTNLSLHYKAILLCEGTSIVGTSEKVYEKSLMEELEYTGKNRVRGEIQGSIEKRYFSKDRVKIHTVEHGIERDSTIYHNLKLESKDAMKGEFQTTAADSKGDANWKRSGS